MERSQYRLNLTGKNLNDVYTLTFPDNLIRFIGFDFNFFIEKSIELCRAFMKSGEINYDDVSGMRNLLAPCHKYVEKNIRGIFDKIVVDFWIDYICRQNDINAATLWNSFSARKNDFEKLIFARISDFRCNRAINRWVNLQKMQNYAKKKVEFIFGDKVETFSDAVVKAGYFDLVFNVAANELGYGELSVNKVYSELQTPNVPFIMSGISREIMRNVLSAVSLDEHYEGESAPVNNPQITDESAMRTFDLIDSVITVEPDNVAATIMKSVPKSYQRVYIPENFKAVIDFEIDALLESGAVLQKCLRCSKYYLRDKNYTYDYCSHVENGHTCLSLMGEEVVQKAPQPVDPSVLQARCDQLYKEMSMRINVDINQRDFSDWYKYLVLIRDNVFDGLATMDDFESFVDYSRSINFIKNNERRERLSDVRSAKHKKEKNEKGQVIDIDENGREIRSFEFEKIERHLIPSKPNKHKHGHRFGEIDLDFDSGYSEIAVESKRDRKKDDDILAAFKASLREDANSKPKPKVPSAPIGFVDSDNTDGYNKREKADYAIPPPTNTARIIRGVVPVGVKELPQQHYDELTAENESVQHDEVVGYEPSDDGENIGFAELINDVEVDTSSNEETVSNAEYPIETFKFMETADLDKTKSSKHGNSKSAKGSKTAKAVRQNLLRSPFMEVPVNPYIKDLLDAGSQAKKVDIPRELPPPTESRPLEYNHGESGFEEVEPFAVNAAEVGDDVQVDNDDNELVAAEPETRDFHAKDTDFTVDVSQSVPQLDFNSILSGIKRNDVFEITPAAKVVNVEKDGDDGEEAASHKTGRVMNAVFGKNKIVNPFLKKDNDE